MTISYYEKIGEKVSEYDADELPYGWSVGSFSQVNIFTSETINPSNSPDEMFELYSVPNFEAGVPEIIRGKEIGSSKQYVCEKDVLVCKINPALIESGSRAILHPIGFSVHLSGLFLGIICCLLHIYDTIFLRRIFANLCFQMFPASVVP